MANLVLGVSGSVAAYRAADLARELMREGHFVRVCLTDSAQKFVTPALFEALTGQPALIDTFEEPERGRMAHIDWARRADAVIVAPATANTIVRLAHGLADDMLTTLVLATNAPLIVAPAMNPHMYANEAFREAMQTLAGRATSIVEPLEGDVACGEHGQGKLASVPQIVEAVRAVLARSQRLAGKRVLITSGPTQEAIDDVRFLSNRSSGKMGAALARAAQLMGAEVTVVAGPQRAPLPLGVNVVRVTTALEMLRAAREHAKDADVVVGAAAVADYRVYQPFHGKHRRDGEKLVLELIPNPDILQDLRTITKPDARRIGFAAEPTDDLTIAREKVYRKDLYAIAANDVSQAGIGFDADENELTLIFADGRTERSGRRTKLGCALWLLETALDEEMTPERARAWLAESQPLPADAPNDQTWRYVQAVLHLTQSPDPQAVPLLLGSLGEDHGMGVRETVLSLVEEADAAHAVPPLLAALRSEHPFRRALAAQAARAFPHEDVRAALLERLETEPDAETRTWIAYSLGEMADDAVTTALRTHIERETDEEVREAIEEVLGG